MVTLICNVDGKPEPNVSWTRNGFSLNTNENADVAISDDQKTPTKVEKHLLVVVVVFFFPLFYRKVDSSYSGKKFLSLFIFITLCSRLQSMSNFQTCAILVPFRPNILSE